MDSNTIGNLLIAFVIAFIVAIVLYFLLRKPFEGQSLPLFFVVIMIPAYIVALILKYYVFPDSPLMEIAKSLLEVIEIPIVYLVLDKVLFTD